MTDRMRSGERHRGWGARDPVVLADNTPYQPGMTGYHLVDGEIVAVATDDHGRENGKNTILYHRGFPVATVGFSFPTHAMAFTFGEDLA